MGFAAVGNDYSALPRWQRGKLIGPPLPLEGRSTKKSLSLQDKWGPGGCQRNLTRKLHLFPWWPIRPSTDTMGRMAKSSKQRTLGFDTEGLGPEVQEPQGSGPESSGFRVQESAGTLLNPEPRTLNPEPQSATPAQTVYLVDSHSLIYQVFHALPEMSGPSGQPVGAVHGFVRDILDLIELRGADYLIAAFDHPGPTFRHELYDQYKMDREEMPADLQLQIPVIQRFLEALGVPSPSLAGFEADDILATLARQAEAAGGECYLVTSDKDCRQLITDRVKMFNIRKGEVFDAAALQATWGIRPDQVVDFQSLVGDKVDNVPGVPLIGPKNA